MGEVTQGKAGAWACRWILSNFREFQGRYCVTVCAGKAEDGFGHNFPAVVDDFGNLVRVK